MRLWSFSGFGGGFFFAATKTDRIFFVAFGGDTKTSVYGGDREKNTGYGGGIKEKSKMVAAKPPHMVAT